MKTISIINNKGGVGKTTTTLSIGYEFTQNYNKKVLLVDLDAQGNLSKMLQKEEIEPEVTISNVLMGGTALKNAIRQTKYQNLDIIPANCELDDVYDAIGSKGNQEILRNALITVADKYDYCIIDTAPSVTIGTKNALVASDEVLVPMCMDVFCFWGLQRITDEIQKARTKNESLYFLGVLFTRFTKTELNQNLEKNMQQQEQYPVSKTHIRESPKVNPGTFEGETVGKFSIRSSAATDYHKFAEDYLNGKLYLQQ